MKLKKVQKVESTEEKKPKLKKLKSANPKPKPKLLSKKSIHKPTKLSGYNVVRDEVLDNVIHIAYTGEYKDNFPYKPEMKAHEVITSLPRLKKLAKDMKRIKEFAFDTETNTLRVLAKDKEFRFVGLSISWGECYNYYIPIGHLRDEDINNQLDLDIMVKCLKPVFERTDVRIIGQNLKFDMHVMKRIGIEIKTKDLFDVMLASWLCDENTPNGLKENSLEKMGLHQTHFAEATGTVPNEVKKEFGYKANSKVPFSLVLIEDGAPYAIADAYYTYLLYLGFVQEIVDEGVDKIFYKMYIPFMLTLFKMEEQGVEVDVEQLRNMGEEMQKDLDELQYKIYEYSGVEFNIGSSQQKAELLFGWIKPSKPVQANKAPKWLLDLGKQYQNNEITLSQLEEKLDKKGYYQENGKVFKKSNVNTNIISRSFGFRPQSETDSGMPKTDSDVIWRISKMSFKTNKRKQQGVEMCKLMLEYSKLAKLKTAFVDGILEQLYEDGKAHPSFNQIGTDSGRLSCSKPNLQQLPKAEDDDKYQIRSVFIGSEYLCDDEGNYVCDLLEAEELGYYVDDYEIDRKKIIALDYHNLEMVCLTYFSKDENLTKMFANDEDAHGSTAVNMFNLDCSSTEVKKLYPHLRMAAKIINFMLMYGGGATALYDALRNDHYSPVDLGAKEYLELYNCKNGVEVAQLFIDKYFNSYNGVARFITGQKKKAHRDKYVRTILGRKRRLPDINSTDRKIVSYCERLSVNSAIQGTAGDITINAQLLIDANERLKELGCFMIIQVHDELVFECPEQNLEEAISIIKPLMEHPFGEGEDRQVPFLRADYDTGDNYQQAK